MFHTGKKQDLQNVPGTSRVHQEHAPNFEHSTEIKGKWENAVASERKNVATRLQVLLTGDRQTPNVTIYDNGEGQTAKDVPNTF